MVSDVVEINTSKKHPHTSTHSSSDLSYHPTLTPTRHPNPIPITITQLLIILRDICLVFFLQRRTHVDAMSAQTILSVRSRIPPQSVLVKRDTSWKMKCALVSIVGIYFKDKPMSYFEASILIIIIFSLIVLPFSLS